MSTTIIIPTSVSLVSPNFTSVLPNNFTTNNTVSIDDYDDDYDNSILVRNRKLFGYIHLVFLFFGLIGNTIIILVLKIYRPKYTATSIYLTCLAVTDNVSIMTWSLAQWLFHAYNINAGSLGLVFCRCYYFLVYSSIQASCWFLAAITIDRVICVILPLRVKTICSTKISTIVAIVIYAFVGLCNSYTLIGVQFKYGEDEVCEFYVEHEYELLIDEIRSIIFVVAMFITPFIIILVGNIMIISQLLKVYHQRKNMSTMAVKFDVTLTITIVVLCLFFLATIAPLYTMNTFDFEGDDDFVDIAELFTNLNAVTNFYLYFISGSTFRKDVKKILLVFKCCLESDRNHSSASSYTPNRSGHTIPQIDSIHTIS